MSATARLVVQMSPKEKKLLEARARRAGVSTAEFVRRRVNAEDLDDHRDEIETLLKTLEATAPAILQSLDRATATVEATSAMLDELHGGSPA